MPFIVHRCVACVVYAVLIFTLVLVPDSASYVLAGLMIVAIPIVDRWCEYGRRREVSQRCSQERSALLKAAETEQQRRLANQVDHR